MHPILFNIGDFPVHSYGMVLALAIIAGISYAMYLGEKRGLDRFDISEVGLWTVIVGLLGARLAFVLQNATYYFVEHPELLLNFRKGGIAIQGALLFGFATTAWTCRRHKISMLNGLDVYIAPVLLGMAMGRIGCVLQGCCYGKVCAESLPWGLVYPAASNLGTLPRHPSQIYEAIMDVVLIVIVRYAYKHAKFYGQAFWTGIAGYGVVRFVSDMFRDFPLLGPLTLGQWAAVGFLILGLLGVIGVYSRQPLQVANADDTRKAASPNPVKKSVSKSKR